ncbi:MAG: site-2 protease family protein, partial [Puniceicoccales bacterium]
MNSTPFFEVLFQSAWGIFLVLLFFNGSIIVHELGHYLAARWRGMKVERFSLFGLGPKLISWKGKDGVEYCICAIPFGAYVALPQLAEMRALEGDGDTQESLPPISYADKMYVAFAGPFFNLILAVIVALAGWYTGYPSYTGGESARIGYVYETLDNGVEGPAWEAGLRAGDVITAIDGKPVKSFKQVPELVALGTGRNAEGEPETTFTIDRDGETKDFVIHPTLLVINDASGDKMRAIGIRATDPMTVGGVAPNSPAARAGLTAGDKILTVADQPVYSIPQIGDILDAHRNEDVTIRIIRDGSEQTLTAKAL